MGTISGPQKPIYSQIIHTLTSMLGGKSEGLPIEDQVFGENGSKMVAKEERGYGLNRNPWKYLVGTRGFEPRTPTASR